MRGAVVFAVLSKYTYIIRQSMRPLPFSILLVALYLRLGMAIGQVTDRPYIEERYTRSARITRVELTERYTIIDMQYGEPNSRQMFRLPMIPMGGQISIDPNSRLYKPGDTGRRYKFIKAEGIPVSPSSRSVRPGEVVNFRVYYERLDPGIEVFDFYEGRNPDQVEYWNFYGVHITNPLPRRSAPRPSAPTQQAPEPSETEPPLQKDPPLVNTLPDNTPSAPELVGLAGTVYNARTRQPIPAQLLYLDQGDSMRVATASGKYRIGISRTGRYSLSVTAKGYLNETLAFNAADSAGKATLHHDFYLTPLAEGASVTLNKIYFATSEYKLLPESFDELNGLVVMLRENPTLKIRIEGHTDNLGDFDKNVELSRYRATAVRDYLIEKGIAPERLEAKGYGPTRPVSRGNSEEERQKNRRVEFVIVAI
jgi:OmpA-OmpF porin, OOP family